MPALLGVGCGLSCPGRLGGSCQLGCLHCLHPHPPPTTTTTDTDSSTAPQAHDFEAYQELLRQQTGVVAGSGEKFEAISKFLHGERGRTRQNDMLGTFWGPRGLLDAWGITRRGRRLQPTTGARGVRLREQLA